MSKLYSLYENLKKENNETIYLFKSGIFYIALAEDAICLSHKFDFKLTKLNDTIVKCGFPASSINKYTKIFTNNNINFKIIDTSNNTAYSPNEYKLNDDISNLLTTISSINIENLSVSEAYKFIEDLKEQSLKIKDKT